MANIKMQLDQLLIEVSGSEEFVKEQYEELAKKCHFYEKAKCCDAGLSSFEQENNNDGIEPVCAEGDLENFFSVGEDGAISINMPVPGNNKAEKIKSLVLLIGYIKKNEWVPFATISEECKRQGCWDSKNFAAYIKQLNPNVMITGKGKNKSVRLTAIGMETAKDKIKIMLGKD